MASFTKPLWEGKRCKGGQFHPKGQVGCSDHDNVYKPYVSKQ